MKTSLVKITKPFEVETDKRYGIVRYDRDNGFPQRIIRLIQHSVTTWGCVDLFSKFMFGQGWTDRTFGETEVGPNGLTGDDLGERIFDEWSKFRGYAILVSINGMFKHIAYQVIPFERVRKGDGKREGQFAVHWDWGLTGLKCEPKDIDWFPAYTSDQETLKGYIEKSGGWEGFKGMIYYHSIDSLNYPTPKFTAALDKVETEAGIATFQRRNVKTGFMASHIFKFNEEFESDEERATMQEKLESFQGDENASKILLIDGVEEEGGQNLTIEKVEIQDVDRLFELTEESAADGIRRTFLLPKSLIGQEESTGFDTERIAQARDYYNSVVIWDRNKCISPLKKLLPHFEKNIKNNDWSVIELYKDQVTPQKDANTEE